MSKGIVKRRLQFILGLLTVLANLVLGIGQHTQAATVISLEFEYLRQGTAGIITLNGADVTSATASLPDSSCRFFPIQNGYACLLAVPMEQRIKDYPLVVTVNRIDGSSAAWEGTLKVASGQFIAEPVFNIPLNKFYLLRQDVEANENARLRSIYSLVTPQRFWGGPFIPPVDGPLTSPFGSVRTYNDGSVRRHMGYDLRAATGVPVQASSNGRVVFARPLDIHGNMVIIDHGWGVFRRFQGKKRAKIKEEKEQFGQTVWEGQEDG